MTNTARHGHRRGQPARGSARATAVAAATSSAGATHTQWCDHDVGDTSNPTPAVATRASGAGARRMTGTASASSAADSSSQPIRPARPSTPARTSTAWKVWLVKNGEPLTPDAGLSSQNFQDSAGATRNPSRVATAPATTVVTAARKSRRSRKYSRNTAGRAA